MKQKEKMAVHWILIDWNESDLVNMNVNLMIWFPEPLKEALFLESVVVHSDEMTRILLIGHLENTMNFS